MAQDISVMFGFLDANCGCCAAAEAFEAQSACAGKQFEHARPLDAVAQTVKYGLFYEVWRGTNVQTFGNFQDSPRFFAAGNAHGCNIGRQDADWNSKFEVRNPKLEANSNELSRNSFDF
jgi:hypothetical protein